MVSIEDIPVEQIYSHPVVKELLERLENIDLEKEVKIPYVMKDKVLMSPGIWNNYYYSSEAIKKAFQNTNWDAKENRSLFLDHMDGTMGDDGKPRMGSLTWVGEVKNQRLTGDIVTGDLVFVDKPAAMKLHYGAKMGISPKVKGHECEGRMVDFTFDNFSVVINPAVKTAYINNSEVSKMTEEVKELKATEQKPAVQAAPAVPEVKVSNTESIEVLMDTLDAIEGELAAGAIAKKAKEIIKKNPDMKWTDAIKQAAKTMSDELTNKKNQEEEEKKKKYPYPEETEKKMNEVKKEMSDAMQKKDEIIQQLTERLEKVEAKLNEPDRASVKTEELAQVDNTDPDVAFMQMLNHYR